VALTFRATVDQAQRFARSKTVGAHFGLAPRRFQSGEMDYDGRVSKCGDAMMRTALYEAAQVLLTRTQKFRNGPGSSPGPCRSLVGEEPRKPSSPWPDASPFPSPHVDRRYGIPLAQGDKRRRSGLIRPEFRLGGDTPLAGTMDEASSQGTRFRFGRTMFRLFRLFLLNPSCGGHRADLGEKREPRETVSKPTSSDEGT